MLARRGRDVLKLWGRMGRVAFHAGVRLLAVGLGANVGPAMGLLHVLFAVGLPLGLVRARLVQALIHGRGR